MVEDVTRQRPVAAGVAVPEAPGDCGPRIPGQHGSRGPPDRQRDIFPLPQVDRGFDDAILARGKPLSRAVRQRIHRRLHWQSWADSGVATLNRMAGHGRPATLGTSAAQERCLEQLADSYKAVGPPLADPTLREEALRELLALGERYTSGIDRTVVNYEPSLASLPDGQASPAPLGNLLVGGKKIARRLCRQAPFRQRGD